MADALTAMLASRDCVLADGATGTNLFAAGLAAGEAPELWNFDAPDKVRANHDGFLGAGADLILTNSFGGNAFRLKLHGAEGRVRDLNARAAEIGRQAVAACGRAAIVAGSIGPSGELLQPVGPLAFDDAVAGFAAQGAALIEGGADILWAETLSSEEEVRAVAAAAAAIGAPFCATLSFDSAGRTMMGVTSARYAEIAADLPGPPVAFGANCGVGAADLIRTVLGLSEAAPGAAIIAKANAGIPKYEGGHIHYDGTPELMADYARLARAAGARVIGGCCGTSPAHLAMMRAALDQPEAEPRPGLDQVAARLGGFSSADDGLGAAPAPRERRRRRAG